MDNFNHLAANQNRNHPQIFNPFYYQAAPGIPLAIQSAVPAPPMMPPLPPQLQYQYQTSAANLDLMQSDKFGVKFDQSFPAELLALFQPLYCKLCLIPITGPKNAFSHYNSKKHELKVRKYLYEYSRRTGLPCHPLVYAKEVQKEPLDSEFLYCEICKVKLTSKVHAADHYAGKNHQSMVLSGKKSSSAANKVAKAYKNSASDTLPDQFLTSATSAVPAGNVQANTQVPVSSTPGVKTPSNGLKFYCKLCDLYASSKENLETHYIGQKHRKAVQKMLKSHPRQSRDVQLTENKREQNLANYRTPSGQFYCEVCKTTTQNENVFRQHLSSKKHHSNRSTTLSKH